MLSDLFGGDDDASDPNYKFYKSIPKPPERKSSCGFSGLSNQGATCYLNSLIQALYMTPELRRGLYEVDPIHLGVSTKDIETASAGANTTADEAKEEEEAKLEGLIAQLVQMGFHQHTARKALLYKVKSVAKCHTVDEALTIALEHGEDADFQPPPDSAVTEAAGDSAQAARKPRKQRTIPLELQKLFVQLQCLDLGAVSTQDLTKRGFNWQSMDGSVQHDAHELNRLLIDALEMSLKTCRSGSTLVQSLYKGELVNEVQCSTCLKRSTREEFYYDVLLQVVNCGDIVESLRQYTTAEVMSGDNQYDCGSCGSKQNALRCVKFKSLPPILTFSCQRFDIDRKTWQRVKVTTENAFPLVLNMNKFMRDRTKGGVSGVPPCSSAAEEAQLLGKVREASVWLDDVAAACDSIAHELYERLPKHTGADVYSFLESLGPQDWEDISARMLMGGSFLSAADSLDQVYDLQAVIMHRGTAYSGHYFAYIRDALGEGNWTATGPNRAQPKQKGQNARKPSGVTAAVTGGNNLKMRQSTRAKALGGRKGQGRRGGPSTPPPAPEADSEPVAEEEVDEDEQMARALQESLQAEDATASPRGIVHGAPKKEAEFAVVQRKKRGAGGSKSNGANPNMDTSTGAAETTPAPTAAPQESEEDIKRAVLDKISAVLLSRYYGQFYEFNDSKVTPLSLLDLQRSFRGKDSAYLLVYRSRGMTGSGSACTTALSFDRDFAKSAVAVGDDEAAPTSMEPCIRVAQRASPPVPKFWMDSVITPAENELEQQRLDYIGAVKAREEEMERDAARAKEPPNEAPVATAAAAAAEKAAAKAKPVTPVVQQPISLCVRFSRAKQEAILARIQKDALEPSIEAALIDAVTLLGECSFTTTATATAAEVSTDAPATEGPTSSASYVDVYIGTKFQNFNVKQLKLHVLRNLLPSVEDALLELVCRYVRFRNTNWLLEPTSDMFYEEELYKPAGGSAAVTSAAEVAAADGDNAESPVEPMSNAVSRHFGAGKLQIRSCALCETDNAGGISVGTSSTANMEADKNELVLMLEYGIPPPIKGVVVFRVALLLLEQERGEPQDPDSPRECILSTARRAAGAGDKMLWNLPQEVAVMETASFRELRDLVYDLLLASYKEQVSKEREAAKAEAAATKSLEDESDGAPAAGGSVAKEKERPVCNNFQRTGKCRNGAVCRFVHRSQAEVDAAAAEAEAAEFEAARKLEGLGLGLSADQVVVRQLLRPRHAELLLSEAQLSSVGNFTSLPGRRYDSKGMEMKTLRDMHSLRYNTQICIELVPAAATAKSVSTPLSAQRVRAVAAPSTPVSAKKPPMGVTTPASVPGTPSSMVAPGAFKVWLLLADATSLQYPSGEGIGGDATPTVTPTTAQISPDAATLQEVNVNGGLAPNIKHLLNGFASTIAKATGSDAPPVSQLRLFRYNRHSYTWAEVPTPLADLLAQQAKAPSERMHCKPPSHATTCIFKSPYSIEEGDVLCVVNYEAMVLPWWRERQQAAGLSANSPASASGKGVECQLVVDREVDIMCRERLDTLQDSQSFVDGRESAAGNRNRKKKKGGPTEKSSSSSSLPGSFFGKKSTKQNKAKDRPEVALKFGCDFDFDDFEYDD